MIVDAADAVHAAPGDWRAGESATPCAIVGTCAIIPFAGGCAGRYAPGAAASHALALDGSVAAAAAAADMDPPFRAGRSKANILAVALRHCVFLWNAGTGWRPQAIF